MKYAFFLTFTLFLLAHSNQSFAVYYSVIGPCSSTPISQGVFPTDLSDSVGQITIDILDLQKIPFVGSEQGIASIANSPVGLDAFEVLSDVKMRSYGWCYSINGEIPDVLASQSFFTEQSDYLVWFYGYSTYDQGVWTDYCVPSYKIKTKQFCK